MKLFQRMRQSTYRRTGDGILGGVFSGLGHRTGISPVVFRILSILVVAVGGGLALILGQDWSGPLGATGSLAAALLLLGYGLAWLLGPRFDDNQIVLEQAVDGRISGTLAGSLMFVVAGTWATGASLLLADSAFYSVLLTGLAVIVLLTLFIRISRRRMRSSGVSGTVVHGSTYSEEAVSHAAVADTAADQPATGAPSSFSTGNSTPETAIQWQIPTPPLPARRTSKVKPPKVSARYTLGALGLACAAAAIGFGVTGMALGAVLVSLGAFVLVLGLAIMLAGVLGKRATWLTALSVFLLLPLAFGATAATFIPSRVLTDDNLDFDSAAPNTPVKFLDRALIPTESLPNDADYASAYASNTTFQVRADEAVIIEIHGRGKLALEDFGGWTVTNSAGSFVTDAPVLYIPGVAFFPEDAVDDLFADPAQATTPSKVLYSVEPTKDALERIRHEVSKVYPYYELLEKPGGDTVTLVSPAAEKDPSQAKRISYEFGPGTVFVRVSPPAGMTDVEYAAKLQGIGLQSYEDLKSLVHPGDIEDLKEEGLYFREDAPEDAPTANTGPSPTPGATATPSPTPTATTEPADTDEGQE